MENVYVVTNNDHFIMGIYRTLENAKRCALEEIEDYCDKYGCDILEKSRYMAELNELLFVDEIVYIESEMLLD